MTKYIIDPTRFHAEGAVVDWIALARRLGLLWQYMDADKLQPTVELRWMLSSDLGMPTEPFQVWVRPQSYTDREIEEPLTITQTQLSFLGGFTAVTWPNGSMSQVSVDVNAPTGGLIAAFSGGPLISNLWGIARVGNGSSTVQLSSPVIDGLLVEPGMTVTGVHGIETRALSQAAGWTLIELVGIPVKRADWKGIGKHGTPQGMTGALTDAPTAAVQRLTRGAPPFGWGPILAAGVPAPPWMAPNFSALVDEVNVNLLNRIRGIIAKIAPNQQARQRIDVPLPAPKNSSGQQMTAAGSTSKVAPLSTMLMIASSDPFLSLDLGFGTAYPLKTDALFKQQYGHNILPRLDYMITAHWEKGLDGASAPVDYAAIIPAPGPAMPPPPPANMTAEVLGTLRPLVADGSWRSSVDINWDRPPDMQLFHAASFAAARAGVSPSEATVALLDTRSSGGFQPITINHANSPPDLKFWRLHMVDRELPIPSNPGSRQVKYGAAIQDIYGQWTPWITVDKLLAQPDLDLVRIVCAMLSPSVPTSGTVCPAKINIEFLWDWRIRSPRLIRFSGRLYAASDHGSPPPSLVVPAGLDRSLAGGGAPLEVAFTGDTPSAPGATIIALNEGGDQQVSFGSAQGGETRRYRLTLSGLSLDFGISGHICLALWAQGQELIPPQRTSAWSDNPTVITASDPRPPVVLVEHVTLASLPDAAGECHARLSWTPQPASVGYFIYESTETKILLANGLPEPTPDQTLDVRLKTLKNAFHGNPSRREFTRRKATLLHSTSIDITLPRGSTSIHLYVVLGISAGNVEGNWPGGAKPEDWLVAIAAPHIMNPAPPLLEVQRFLDQTSSPPVYKARINITTRPGPRVKKVELHRVRVDDAAKELDTMGPPIARIKTSGGGWTVTQAVDRNAVSYIQTVQGVDAPSGSWRRVWYRATGWTEQDDMRGALPGRSPASAAAWVVIPPADAPVVSPLSLGGSSGPADVLIEWTSPAPLKKTPLGPHTMSVSAMLPGADSIIPAGRAPNGPAPLISFNKPLDQLDTNPPATGSGVWVFSSALDVTVYRALIRRATITDIMKFIVRITDPLGRTGERIVTIGAGPVDPAPDLTDLVLHKIPGPPPKTAIEFASTVPLKAPLDGPYRVHVTAFVKGRVFPPFPPHPPLVLDMSVGSVPGAPPQGRPPIEIHRNPAPGPKITYVVVCAVAVAKYVVRIIAPDGRLIEKTQLVS